MIRGLENMSEAEIHTAIDAGGRFVVYQYCISIIIMSFKRSSSVHFVPAGKSAALRGLPYIGTSMLLGWWGIPWGPFWTVATTVKNLSGGIDVTDHYC